MRFWVLSILLILFLMNVWHTDAHQDGSDDKSPCHDLEEDGFCRFKMFRCYMEDHCSNACGFRDEEDNELVDQDDYETPGRHKRNVPRRRHNHKKGKHYGRKETNLPIDEAASTGKRRNKSQRNKKQRNRSNRNKPKHRKRRPKHFNSPKYRMKNHHWHSDVSKSLSGHRYTVDYSEDRSYCNDFKQLGLCNIVVFKCFMKDYCSKTCGLATEPSAITQPPSQGNSVTSDLIIHDSFITTTKKTNEVTEKPIITTAPPIRTTGVAISEASLEFNQKLLEAHNKYRRMHSTPDLVLDNDLIKGAQEWAEYLATNDVLEHAHELNGVGENLAWSSRDLTAIEAVRNWYEEITDYDYNNPGFSFKAGHFTQVVWKSSKRLGGGIAKTSDGATYIVARYSPAGNVNTKSQFRKNVLPLRD